MRSGPWGRERIRLSGPLLWLLGSSLLLAPDRASAGDVAVLMTAKAPAYEEAVRGFILSSGHSVVATYDMKGSRDRGRKFVKEIEKEVKPDLVLAVGIFALEVTAERDMGIPVVYAMVMNPPNVLGLNERHITGASMNVPVARAIEVFQQLSGRIRRIGTIFNPEHTGFIVKEAQSVTASSGLTLVAKEVRSTGEAVSALDELREEGIDAVWILPDSTVLAPAFIEHLLLFCYRSQLPLLGLSRRQAEMGALVSLYYLSNEDIGRQAGELAKQILEQEDSSILPFTRAREVGLAVNLKTAERIGIEVPEGVVTVASEVIQ